jgi:ABC-2 type transport system permease protein
MLRAYGAAAFAIMKRDALIFASYRLQLISDFVSTVFGMTVFYYVSRLVQGGQFETSDEYFAFAVVGVVVLGIVTSGLSDLPGSLRGELVVGTFERLLVSPFGALRALLAMVFFPFLSGLASGFVTLSFAALVFDMPLRWSMLPLAALAAFLGVLAFMPFAVAITAAVLVVKQAGAGAGLLITLMSLFGGAFFPVSLLPDWIEWTAHVQPFTPAVDLLRHLLIGTPLDAPWGAVARLIGFAAVLLPVSIVFFQACLAFGQRRGTVLEY